MEHSDTPIAPPTTIRVGDKTVGRIGLGTNRITDTNEARAMLRRAVELGLTAIDTAHVYTAGASETTIGHALAPYPADLLIATKGGMPDTRPEDLRIQLDESLSRLQTDAIELYQLHRVNPDVPLEESVGMLRTFQDEGKIKHIGLSEVTVDQLRQAQAVAPIVSVQNEYNVAVRKYEPVVDYCTEQGIVFIPWFPLGGLRGGTAEVSELVSGIARKVGATDQQVALAWLLQRSPMMLPIPGTLSIDHLQSNLDAIGLRIDPADFDGIA